MITVDLAAARPVLLVIDMQAVFVSPDGPFANTRADALIGRINAFTVGCREAGVPVVFCTYLLAEDGSDAGLLAPFDWAVHFRRGAPFAGVDPRLTRSPGDLEVPHHRPGAQLQPLARRAADEMVVAARESSAAATIRAAGVRPAAGAGG